MSASNAQRFDPGFPSSQRTALSRRVVLKGALVGAGVLALPQILGACGDDDEATTTTAAPGTTGGGTGEVTSTELEVFSWWTGGGEAAGLDAMIAIWNSQYPNTKFVNAAVAGGAGSNAKAVLAQRLEANDPPDSFQGHAGAELSDYIKAGQVEELNSYYEEWGLGDVFPSDLVDQITVDGKIYSVPVNIHRANVLWSNPTVVADAGITATPESFDDFIAALDKVKAAGKTPLALAEQWTVKHLMETVMISKLGAEAWAGLWTADGDWSSADVTDALEGFKTLFGYVNSDYASLTWQDAAKRVVDGEAAYNVMGDWADGYFTELEKTPRTDYDWAPVPGTAGVYDWLSDSFTKAKGGKHPDATVAWLKLCSSKEGQDAFNPVKGSIPARKDADTSKYGVYLQSAMEDWKTATLAGSLAHGVVASNAWNTDIDGALGLFLEDKDVAAFQDALLTAHDTYAV
ncbi:MAG: ABC transporter substrate-binding protein [Actinomycetota bacterium]|nr:ABC transporter substrate-binding protein [Actinomycetota bacterium]